MYFIRTNLGFLCIQPVYFGVPSDYAFNIFVSFIYKKKYFVRKNDFFNIYVSEIVISLYAIFTSLFLF